MACNIDKMLIKGIRSFSPDNQIPIEFYKPLTLIVGQNGAGKTVRTAPAHAVPNLSAHRLPKVAAHTLRGLCHRLAMWQPTPLMKGLGLLRCTLLVAS